MCDGYSGYTALFKGTIIEVGCLAHARRKFHALWVNKQSPIAEQALQFYQAIYAVEAHARELDDEERKRLRQVSTQPILARFHEWLIAYSKPSWTPIPADRGQRSSRSWTPFQPDRGRRSRLIVDT